MENIPLRQIHTKVFGSDGHRQIILKCFKGKKKVSCTIPATFLHVKKYLKKKLLWHQSIQRKISNSFGRSVYE